MHLPLHIALRYLRSKKSHSAVNIISIVSVCGVIVATAAIVCVLSVFNGFSKLIHSKLSMLDADIAITATLGKTIADADSVAAVARGVAGVEMALPVVEDNALAMFFNPTDSDITRTIEVPLYYAGLTQSVNVRREEGAAKRYTLSADQKVTLEITIPAKGFTWYVFQ